MQRTHAPAERPCLRHMYMYAKGSVRGSGHVLIEAAPAGRLGAIKVVLSTDYPFGRRPVALPTTCCSQRSQKVKIIGMTTNAARPEGPIPRRKPVEKRMAAATAVPATKPVFAAATVPACMPARAVCRCLCGSAIRPYHAWCMHTRVGRSVGFYYPGILILLVIVPG